MTASLRFNGDLNTDLKDIKTNLVPYPRIHFPVVSYAPFQSRERADHKTYSIQELTDACFNKDNLMVKCDVLRKDFQNWQSKAYSSKQEPIEKYMSCFMLYRGDVAASNVNASIQSIKQNKWGLNLFEG